MIPSAVGVVGQTSNLPRRIWTTPWYRYNSNVWMRQFLLDGHVHYRQLQIIGARTRIRETREL